MMRSQSSRAQTARRAFSYMAAGSCRDSAAMPSHSAVALFGATTMPVPGAASSAMPPLVTPAGHGLQHDQADGFAVARMHQRVAVGQQPRQRARVELERQHRHRRAAADWD
jgi:hypothetical protein